MPNRNDLHPRRAILPDSTASIARTYASDTTSWAISRLLRILSASAVKRGPHPRNAAVISSTRRSRVESSKSICPMRRRPRFSRIAGAASNVALARLVPSCPHGAVARLLPITRRRHSVSTWVTQQETSMTSSIKAGDDAFRGQKLAARWLTGPVPLEICRTGPPRFVTTSRLWPRVSSLGARRGRTPLRALRRPGACHFGTMVPVYHP